MIFFFVVEVRKKSERNARHSQRRKLCVDGSRTHQNVGKPHFFGLQKICKEQNFIQVADDCPQIRDDGDADAVALHYAHDTKKSY